MIHLDVNVEFKGKKEQASSTIVEYKDVEMLHPGTYTDSLSGQMITYDRKELERHAFDWKDNKININHSHHPLDLVGEVVRPFYSNAKNALSGTVRIYKVTQAARDIANLIDLGFVNKLSIELECKSEEVKDKGLMATDVIYEGVAVVLNPADTATKIK